MEVGTEDREFGGIGGGTIVTRERGRSGKGNNLEDGLSEVRALYVWDGGYRDVKMKLSQTKNGEMSRGGAAVRAKRDVRRTGGRK